MDPRVNPYSPGAGSPPPELAGREQVIESVSIALDRMRNGLVARSVVLFGLRGVGKTVLLNRLQIEAEAKGLTTVLLEAPEKRSLPALLLPAMRTALLKLDRMVAGGDMALRALRALGSFVQAMRLKYDDIEFGIDLGVEPGVADTGDLDADLSALFQAVGEAARERRTVVALFIDELQYVPESQLAALIMALHRCAQRSLPVTMIGAGLPQLLGNLGEAKSYAERLFEFHHIGTLPDPDARRAIEAPAQRSNVRFTDSALSEILHQTQGYPYFLQAWGKQSWQCAQQSPITDADVRTATQEVLSELDASFFRVRLDRLTNAEKRYLRAMADLGPGPHRSGDIATRIGRAVQTVAPIRAKLIEKGMIYSPAHGDTAFTVPLFDAYCRRVMPELG